MKVGEVEAERGAEKKCIAPQKSIKNKKRPEIKKE